MQVRAFERYIPLMADSTIIQFVAYPKDVQSILVNTGKFLCK